MISVNYLTLIAVLFTEYRPAAYNYDALHDMVPFVQF